MKKVFLIFLCFLLILSFGACKSNELGKVKEVEIENPKENNIDAENVFSPIENTLGYEMKTYNNGRTYMSFPLPANWKVEWKNDRNIVVTSPANDPIFKATTIHIFSDLTSYNNPTIDKLGYTINTMKETLYKSSYSVEGKLYKADRYQSPSFTTDVSFAPDHEDMISLGIIDDVYIHGDHPPIVKYDFYVNWCNVYTIFSMMVAEEKKEQAMDLLYYIVSNIKYYQDSVQKVNMVETTSGNMQLAIPSQFKKEDSSNIKGSKSSILYKVPEDSGSVYSGMTIGAYCMDKQAAADIADTYTDPDNDYIIAEIFANEFPNYITADNVHSSSKWDGSLKIGNKLSDKSLISYSGVFADADNNGKFIQYSENIVNLIYIFNFEHESEIITISTHYAQFNAGLDIIEILEEYSKVE